MLQVIDDAVRKMAGSATRGRVFPEDIPVPLQDLAHRIYNDMTGAVYGNHHSIDIASAMNFLGRFCRQEFYEDGQVPLLYFLALGTVAKNWSDRCLARTGKLPVEDESIREMVLPLYSMVERKEMRNV